jgi:hypothetical protein
MKINQAAFCASAALSLLSSVAQATNGTGFVTPTEMTITFTDLRLVKADNSQLTLMSGTFPHTFKKSDAAFASVPLTDITAPAGRFIGVQVCYNTDRTVKINGEKYEGTTVGSYSTGASIYSIGSASTAAGAVQVGGSPTVTTLTGYTIGNGTNNCSQTYFSQPVCVTTDPASCASGDSIVDAGTTPPNLNLLLDLYNSVAVDANNNSLDNHVPIYPYPTIGTPGAAMHLTGGSGGNISLLFGSDRKLIYSAAYATGSVSGLCGGNGFVNVTAAPAGAFMNSYGPTAVQSIDTSTGKVQFAAGNSGTTNTSVSGGMNVLDNVFHPQGATANVTCVADSAATPPYLGYTYTSGAGITGTTAFTIKRIVDPSGLFSASGTTCSGTCGSYP